MRRGAWSADADLLRRPGRDPAVGPPAPSDARRVRAHGGARGAPGPASPAAGLRPRPARHLLRGAGPAGGRPRWRERWPGATWECSHVGGDRFAANLVVLPDGACYGNLDADTAVDVVSRTSQGRVDVDHLRGISTQPPVAQAAVAAALRRFGPAALVAGGRERRRATRVGVLAGHPHRHADPCRRGWRRRSLRTRTAPARLTCRAAGPTSAYRYDGPRPAPRWERRDGRSRRSAQSGSCPVPTAVAVTTRR